MSKLETFTVKPSEINASNFNPRNYSPLFLFVKNKLISYSTLQSTLSDDVKGGSPPPHWLFKKKYEDGIPFVKTSAIRRDFINVNDLHFIHKTVHENQNQRSATKPYHVIFSMTGKFMGKAALCPPTIPELNMSQNSVVLKCKSKKEAAFLCIFLNSIINQTQIKGLYTITKQKYLNQGKIKELKILEYEKKYEKSIELYLKNILDYYNSIDCINSAVKKFDEYLGIKDSIFDETTSFVCETSSIEKINLAVPYYRKDFQKIIAKITKDKNSRTLNEMSPTKGDEIESVNYLTEGIPFIKTSDIQNFSVDYQPDNYCADAIFREKNQGLQIGDILFTKDGKIGEVALLEESSKIVISSGFVVLKPKSDDERYWVFLLLASNYGKIFFSRWTVIASTMPHLRSEFFGKFIIPEIDKKLKNKLILELKKNFKKKTNAFNGIEKAKLSILDSLYNEIKIKT